MKKYNNAELKKILNNIKNGTMYGAIFNNKGSFGEIYLTEYGNIGYSHYGSSAVKCTIKDLKWLLEIIFKDNDEIVPVKFSEYHLNYIPIDSKYNGLDMSTKHPNVAGL